jgi:hypothetical protein
VVDTVLPKETKENHTKESIYIAIQKLGGAGI